MERERVGSWRLRHRPRRRGGLDALGDLDRALGIVKGDLRESGRVAIYLLLEVVGAVISAALLTDDPFGWREGAGCLLIVGAGLLEGLDELRRRRLPIARPA